MRLISSLFACLLLAACHHHDDDCDRGGGPADPRLVSILVEVYDPVTNFVWENVTVRILEADQEWCGCTYVSPLDASYLTDVSGRVLLDEDRLAAANIGFLEDGFGRAVLGARSFEDQATVLLEIDAPGFVPVYVEVPLRWDQPDVFVEVPFS